MLYRCECGKKKVHSTVGINPCDRCHQCNMGLTWDPDITAEPSNHHMHPHLLVCVWCFRTDDQIKSLGEPSEWQQ